MVQDYIGALNVALAMPFLAIGGVNVVALRWLSLLTGGLTLLVTWRVAWRLGGPLAASATALLLTVNPAFIFWSRQGVFVTNLTALIFMTSLLAGLRWWESRRPRDLWLTAFLCGLGLYAKLLSSGRSARCSSSLSWPGWSKLEARKPEAGLSTPRAWKRLASNLGLNLDLFPPSTHSAHYLNLRSGGTLNSIFSNLGQSYYGVNNSAYLPNLLKRLGQLVTLLRGDFLGYLGGPFANAWAPWLLLILLLLAGIASALAARRQGAPGGLNQESSGTGRIRLATSARTRRDTSTRKRMASTGPPRRGAAAAPGADNRPKRVHRERPVHYTLRPAWCL